MWDPRRTTQAAIKAPVIHLCLQIHIGDAKFTGTRNQLADQQARNALATMRRLNMNAAQPELAFRMFLSLMAFAVIARFQELSLNGQ